MSKSTQEWLEEWEPTNEEYSDPIHDFYDRGEAETINSKSEVWDTQVGGDHYTKLKIQPLEYALANNLGICEHAVVKYVTRHESKGGAQDIRKAIDYLIKILKHRYNENY